MAEKFSPENVKQFLLELRAGAIHSFFPIFEHASHMESSGTVLDRIGDVASMGQQVVPVYGASFDYGDYMRLHTYFGSKASRSVLISQSNTLYPEPVSIENSIVRIDEAAGAGAHEIEAFVERYVYASPKITGMENGHPVYEIPHSDFLDAFPYLETMKRRCECWSSSRQAVKLRANILCLAGRGADLKEFGILRSDIRHAMDAADVINLDLRRSFSVDITFEEKMEAMAAFFEAYRDYRSYREFGENVPAKTLVLTMYSLEFHEMMNLLELAKNFGGPEILSPERLRIAGPAAMLKKSMNAVPEILVPQKVIAAPAGLDAHTPG